MLCMTHVRFADVVAPFSATNTTNIAGFQARTDCLPNQCRLIVVRGLAVASGFAVSCGSGRLDLPSSLRSFGDQNF